MKFFLDTFILIVCGAILIFNMYIHQQNKILADYNEQLRNDNILLLESYDKLLKAMYVEDNY